MKLQKRDIDVSRVFLAYIGLQGDVNRTALACQMEPQEVAALAAQENWQSKLDGFAALKEQDANFQVTLNRTLNFVQARQLSTVIDEVLKRWTSNPEALLEDLTTTTKNGSTFSTKPIVDLVKAAEAVQLMTSRALGDTGANLTEDKAAGGSIGLSVARALNAVAENAGVDAVTIVKQSLEPHGNNPRLPGAATPTPA